jgi:hypothetical protein
MCDVASFSLTLSNWAFNSFSTLAEDWLIAHCLHSSKVTTVCEKTNEGVRKKRNNNRFIIFKDFGGKNSFFWSYFFLTDFLTAKKGNVKLIYIFNYFRASIFN